MFIPVVTRLQELSLLTERLSRLNEDLARKMQGASKPTPTNPQGSLCHAQDDKCPRVMHSSSHIAMTSTLSVVAARNEFDQTIQETEAAYMKVRGSLLGMITTQLA